MARQEPYVSYTLVTAHFGDPSWISHTLSQVHRFSGSELREVVVIDQSRSASMLLQHLPRVSKVITLEIDQDQQSRLGHDHPASLNRVIHSYPIATDRIIVLDSDCFPLRRGWLNSKSSIRLAQDPFNPHLTHPCFMDFPTSARKQLDFSEDLVENGADTGRLVGRQLTSAGYAVDIMEATPAFGGVRGHYYNKAGVYHHGSGSFVDHPDFRLSSQVSMWHEKHLRARVMSGNFSLPPSLAAQALLKGAKRKIRDLT